MNFQNKWWTSIRWVVFLPFSLIGALLLAGIFNVIIQFSRSLFCYLAIFSYSADCSSSYGDRLFIADIVMYALFVYLIYKIVPKWKLNIARGFSLLMGIFLILLQIYYFFTLNMFNFVFLGQMCIGLVMIVWAIIPSKVKGLFNS